MALTTRLMALTGLPLDMDMETKSASAIHACAIDLRKGPLFATPSASLVLRELVHEQANDLNDDDMDTTEAGIGDENEAFIDDKNENYMDFELYILAMDGLPKLTAKELKSQRARERYTALSVEEKAAWFKGTVKTGRGRILHLHRAQKCSSVEDVAAVVCDVDPVDHYANFPNSVRKVALMDSKNQELLQPAEQNNAPGEPEVVIVEDDEVVIEPLPKKKRTGNKG
ncbi:hypothetical protein OsI_37708 [Oryza sativa Indica Group]|uniref:Uncharacterized protein n=1 Tax=Oryza sativa subsp. indica TaxID=39946 RepID=A2ZIQ7_ORYSI|nr:hypothetical protein OsI_37708 [Oryza sativa Indica Group]